MTNINFDSEDLSFNLQFNNPGQIEQIAASLANTFHGRSTLFDQSSKKRTFFWKDIRIKYESIRRTKLYQK